LPIRNGWDEQYKNASTPNTVDEEIWQETNNQFDEEEWQW